VTILDPDRTKTHVQFWDVDAAIDAGPDRAAQRQGIADRAGGKIDGEWAISIVTEFGRGIDIKLAPHALWTDHHGTNQGGLVNILAGPPPTDREQIQRYNRAGRADAPGYTETHDSTTSNRIYQNTHPDIQLALTHYQQATTNHTHNPTETNQQHLH